MITAGISWISGGACGSLRRGWRHQFEDPKNLYQLLESEGCFSVPLAKVRWLNTVSQRFCLAAGLALRDAYGTPEKLRSDLDQTGVISLSRDGALQSNLEYFKDYVSSGRKLARGNLFVHTLPTSPLAETAITFGFKGPVFHLSALDPKMALLINRSEALGKKARLNLLCFAADENGIICFFLKPEGTGADFPGFSLKEIQKRIGHLWNLKEIFTALQIETEITQH